MINTLTKGSVFEIANLYQKKCVIYLWIQGSNPGSFIFLVISNYIYFIANKNLIKSQPT